VKHETHCKHCLRDEDNIHFAIGSVAGGGSTTNLITKKSYAVYITHCGRIDASK